MFSFHLSLSFTLLLVSCSTTETETTHQKNDTNISNSDLEQWAEQYLTEMNTLVDSSEDFRIINDLENIVSEIQKNIVQPWENSWETKNFGEYEQLFLEQATGLQWDSNDVVETRTVLGIKESNWNIENVQSEQQIPSLTTYIEQFETIEDLSLKVVYIEKTSDDQAIATIEFDLRGIKSNETRQQDRGHISLNCKKTDGIWKIESMSSSTMERLESLRSPAFTDATEHLGLTTILPIEDRKEAIRRGGYALVVSDYDNDGYKDMLVGNYGPIHLLRNTGNGFEDVTELAGLDQEEVIKGAGFVDMDNDGLRDIVMLRFTDASDPRGDFVIYENNGDGTFSKHSNILPKRRSYDTPMPLSMGDYNNDGFIDIYIGFPGVRDFTSDISSSTRPDWQASQGIWFNKGNWIFEEAADDNAIVSDNNTYSHAAASTDLDGDGWIDLLIVDDSGRINPVFRNTGDENFSLVSDDMGLMYAGTSMGVSTGDFNNDGHVDIMSSHIAMNAGSRMAYSTDGILDDSSLTGQIMKHVRENYVDVQLFQNNGDGTFSDITSTANLQWAGEAAGAGEWLDYNHDGLLDYYVPNGLWSSGEEQLDSLFFRASMITHGGSMVGIETEQIPFNMMNDVSGGSIFSVSETGGANTVLTLLRNHRTSPNGSLALSFVGKQHNALFRNNGDGTFTEVGFLEGADRIEDGYIVAPVDINNDGLQDLVLRNTDPAPEQQFHSVIVLENQLEGNTLSVTLNSTEWNTDGLGARVVAFVGDQIISREIRSVSGAVQAEPVAYFGLGDAEKVDKLVVTWPGGEQQEVHDIDKGFYTIQRSNP